MVSRSGSDDQSKTVVRTVFIALVLDLLAFTLPLPLFPRLIAWYLHREAHTSSTLLARLLGWSYRWRAILSLDPDIAGGVGVPSTGTGKNWDVVLLGGAIGSLFSLCQCVISPWLGGLSDRYGRKRVLLCTMVGNVVSAVIWLYSTSFSSYLVSRLVGGLSEGNVQLSTAIISDVTTETTRSRSLALIGIAFSICFTLGPSIGAYFASRSLLLAPPNSDTTTGTWNVFAVPAAISLMLLVAETVYLAIKLPETRSWRKVSPSSDASATSKSAESVDDRLKRIRAIGRLHGLFLLFFSGAEFTLTFLTYDLFAATNAQNGRLLSFIGILSASLQARYVRRSMSRVGELRLARQGVTSCVLALLLLSLLPHLPPSHLGSTITLYASASLLAYTSAAVVSCLTASAAACCDESGASTSTGGEPRLQRGRALGGYRSKGQLGRAVGPILASSVYWCLGPSVAYAGLAVCLAGVIASMKCLITDERERRRVKTS